MFTEPGPIRVYIYKAVNESFYINEIFSCQRFLFVFRKEPERLGYQYVPEGGAHNEGFQTLSRDETDWYLHWT